MFFVSAGEITCGVAFGSGVCQNDAAWFGFWPLADDFAVLPAGVPGESGLMVCGRCGSVGPLWGVQSGVVPVLAVLSPVPAAPEG